MICDVCIALGAALDTAIDGALERGAVVERHGNDPRVVDATVEQLQAAIDRHLCRPAERAAA